MNDQIPSPLVDDEYYENLTFDSVEWLNVIARSIKFEQVSITRSDLSGSKFPNLKASDFQIRNTNMAGVEVEEANFFKGLFNEDKLTGIKFIQPIFDQVSITNCSSQMLIMLQGKFKKVSFVHCDLKNSDFGGSQFHDCIFKDCDMSETDFSGCQFSNTDIRGSVIDNARISSKEVPGLIVTTDQALYLSGLLGIDIRD